MQRMMHLVAAACAVLCVATGCDDGDVAAPPCGHDLPERSLSFCSGPTSQLYDPVTATSAALAVFDSFPDDLLTHADPDSATGLRVATDAATLPRVLNVPAQYASVITDLSLLDGWGTTAGLYLRFDGPVAEPPSGLPASLQSPALILAAVTAGKATRVPFEARLLDDGTTLLVEPMVPMTPATRHVLVVTRQYLAAGGGCIAPAAVLKGLLERRGERIKIAEEAQRKFGRTVSWGVEFGDPAAPERILFTHIAAPVMTRLRQPERRVLDTLVDAGVARSRADALAWSVRLVGEHAEEWLAKLRAAMEKVDDVRAQGPGLSG